MEDYSGVTQIGVDETSKAKGHDYVSLFVDLGKKRTLFVAEGKGSQTMAAFAEDLQVHHGHPDQIADVSIDMSPAFIKGVAECLPKAAITFDKYHIMKIINTALDEVNLSMFARKYTTDVRLRCTTDVRRRCTTDVHPEYTTLV
ncbi:MAG: transposase [Coprothermobacterota bacterium]|nr:transposase [Coprothermobacterota bacterium]